MKKKNWIFPLLFMGFTLMLTNRCEKESKNSNSGNPVDSTSKTTEDTVITAPAGWSKVGNLNANEMIWSLASDGSNNIYAAGNFTNASGYNYVAKWNGTVWSELGMLKANSSIFALATDASGNVYAVGSFTDGATPDGGSQYVAKWDGSNWNNIGGGGGTILTADAIGNIYRGTSKWNGSAWSTICPVCTLNVSSVKAMVSNAPGTFQYAGGDLQLASGYRYVAKCDGSNCWSELGSLNANNDIQALATDTSGNVYAAGSFTNGILSTNGYYYVAKWNGTTWSELGNLNANGNIYFLAIDVHHGYLYASGYFTNSNGGAYVAKWDGTTWSDLGDMGLSPTPIMVAASGKLYSVIAGTNGKEFCVVVHD